MTQNEPAYARSIVGGLKPPHTTTNHRKNNTTGARALGEDEMSIYEISTVRTTGGFTHPYLQGIDLIGNKKTMANLRFTAVNQRTRGDFMRRYYAWIKPNL